MRARDTRERRAKKRARPASEGVKWWMGGTFGFELDLASDPPTVMASQGAFYEFYRGSS